MPTRGGAKTMIMEATAGQNIWYSTMYKQKKRLPLSAHDHRKPIRQAVFTSLPTGNRVRTAYLHCIKDSTNIDPPYNTGHDFIYPDSYIMDNEEYNEGTGYFDDDGNVNYKRENGSSAGKYHSDWCSMIYARLMLARDLLRDDGAIFISIGDDEEANLIKICDEVFGEQNFISSICHKARASVSNDRIVSENHNHLIFYAKKIDILFAHHQEIGEDPELKGYDKEDKNGKYKLTPVDGPGGAKKGNPYYEFLGVSGYWRYSKETMQAKYNAGLIVRTDNNLQQKYYLYQAEKSRRTVTTWWDDDFLTSSATSEFIKLMGGKYFDNPKNTNLILRCLKMMTKFDKDAIILDFFSGSATTAHSTMQFNAEDGGNRRFILVQLPEPCDEKSEAYKAGYKNICEIGMERIRRAAQKIHVDNPDATFDDGFRVLKLDETNMKAVYYSADEYDQGMLKGLESNIKDDRTDLDLLFGCLLEWGLPLSLQYSSETIEGCTVHTYNGGDLIACFNENVPETVIKAIAKRQPLRAVFRDNSFIDSPSKINVGEIFKLLAPDTRVKVI